MWRRLLASARNGGVSAARKATAPRAGVDGEREDAMSSPRDWPKSSAPAPSAAHGQPPAAAPVAPSRTPTEAAPLVDESADKAIPNVSRETSDDYDTPIGAAAERAMRVLHTTYPPLRRPGRRRVLTVA